MDPWSGELFLHSVVIYPYLRASSIRIQRRLNMLIKSQKLACSLQSNLTFRAFSPREAYHEGSVKSAPHLRERQFLAAILTADDVEDLSRSFNDV